MSHGKFVAASTITTLPGSALFAVIPSICISSSDFTRRDASCSDSEPLREHRESISSMNIVLGA